MAAAAEEPAQQGERARGGLRAEEGDGEGGEGGYAAGGGEGGGEGEGLDGLRHNWGGSCLLGDRLLLDIADGGLLLGIGMFM